MELQNGDILHCSGNKLLSGIIKHVTNSVFSHTALVLEINGMIFICDSQKDGTRIRSISKWEKDHNYKYVVSRPINEPKDLINKVEPYLNSRYGFIDLVRHLIYRYTKIWLGSRREDKNLVCSEFVMRVYGAKDAYKKTPQDAYTWCLFNDFILIKHD